MVDDDLTERIIGAAIEVHRRLGPGLLESTYENCLAIELNHPGLQFERQNEVPIIYRDVKIDNAFRIDFLVENRIVLELKAVKVLDDVHFAQVLSYLKLTSLQTGLLINFNVARLVDGIRRIAN